MRLAFLLPCFLSISVSEKDYGNATISEVTSIYDVDTFRVNLEGYRPIVGEHICVRVQGVDTPEIKGKGKQNRLVVDRTSS